ncbi:hypothetical protein PUN28_004827 [Cardiocondyla obscurior]|uniref:Secreted protein n=1 Tax=Cardiocondyla obscurior TaxID=286306 RepID=A0AAW2GEN3_9HYME
MYGSSRRLLILSACSSSPPPPPPSATRTRVCFVFSPQYFFALPEIARFFQQFSLPSREAETRQVAAYCVSCRCGNPIRRIRGMRARTVKSHPLILKLNLLIEREQRKPCTPVRLTRLRFPRHILQYMYILVVYKIVPARSKNIRI